MQLVLAAGRVRYKRKEPFWYRRIWDKQYLKRPVGQVDELRREVLQNGSIRMILGRTNRIRDKGHTVILEEIEKYSSNQGKSGKI